MTARGKIRNGKVVLDDPQAIPEGTEVEVRPAKPRKRPTKGKPPKAKPRPRSLADRLANVRGKATGLPEDAAVNHDHYLYDLPTRE